MYVLLNISCYLTALNESILVNTCFKYLRKERVKSIENYNDRKHLKNKYLKRESTNNLCLNKLISRAHFQY